MPVSELNCPYFQDLIKILIIDLNKLALKICDLVMCLQDRYRQRKYINTRIKNDKNNG